MPCMDGRQNGRQRCIGLAGDGSGGAAAGLQQRLQRCGAVCVPNRVHGILNPATKQTVSAVQMTMVQMTIRMPCVRAIAMEQQRRPRQIYRHGVFIHTVDTVL